jgi:ferredoxin
MLFVISIAAAFHGVDRFPRPEFESDYKLPETQTPLSRSIFFNVLDVAVLTLMLAVSSYVIMKRKSRLILISIMIVSVAYFGFFKKGCICPIGSIQNVALFVFSNNYVITIFTLLFFVLPVVFTIFFGRSFCSGVCPFGAVQELVLIKPLKVPAYVDGVLRFIPVAYLFMAVLFTLNDAGFVICLLDPFVSFFRMSGDLWKIIYGGLFLLIAMFIARPYCRYLCPYGLILSFASRISRRHITLTSNECNSCGICGSVCPVNSIKPPVNYENLKAGAQKRLVIFIFPVILAASGISGYFFGNILSAFHPKVKLAREMVLEEKSGAKEFSVDSKAYRDNESDISKIFYESLTIVKIFKIATAVLFLSLAGIAMFFIYVSTGNAERKRYMINKFTCVSCMKCTELCPRE